MTARPEWSRHFIMLVRKRKRVKRKSDENQDENKDGGSREERDVYRRSERRKRRRNVKFIQYTYFSLTHENSEVS